MDFTRFHVTFCTYFNYKEEFIYPYETYPEYVLFCVNEGTFAYGMDEAPVHVASAGDVVLCLPGQAFHRKTITPVSFCMIKFTSDNMPYFSRPLIKVKDASRLFANINFLKESFFSKEICINPAVNHYCDDIIYQVTAVGQKSNSPLWEALNFINNHYTEDVLVEKLAAQSGYSTVHFINVFKKYYGHTPKAYISLLRLNQAQQLLTESDRTVNEVASLCGFSDALYFSRFFREHFNVSPSVYRKTVAKAREV